MHIHIYPDPILKAKAIPISEINSDIQSLIGDMERLMYENKGIGLAANQIGIPMSIIIFDVEGKGLTTIINPIISSTKGEFISEEGCLSLPGFKEKIKRKKYIHVEGTDRYYKPIIIEAEDLVAACIQHEINHLEGFLLLDKVSGLKRSMYLRKLRRYYRKDNNSI